MSGYVISLRSIFIFNEYIMLRTIHLNTLTKRLSVFVILGLLAPTVVHAFTEDLCFQYVDKQAKSGDVIPKAFQLLECPMYRQYQAGKCTGRMRS